MHLTIGILAYNEETRIARTILSLLEQSALSDARWMSEASVEIIIVPNGCRDQTEHVAVSTLCAASRDHSGRAFTYRVNSLEVAGKSNAWNECVHRFARPDTDIFVMMDADIEFGHPDTIANCVARLLADDAAQICVDLPLNDLTRKSNRTLFERCAARLSPMKFVGPPGVAGSFYCARGERLRQVWMPIGLPGEDGFLSTMVATDCMRSSPVPGWVVRADNASHYYEGLSTFSAVLRHEIRLAIGTALNCYLCWDALALLTKPSGEGAGALIRDLNDEQPTWYVSFIHNSIASRGPWVLPRGMAAGRVRERFRGFREKSLATKLTEAPLRAAAAVADMMVLLVANRMLRRKRAVHFW